MKKLIKGIVILFILLVLGYALAAALACWHIPNRIRETEARMPAVQVALKEVTKDRLTLSQRIHDITDRHRSADKTALVYAFLNDREINLLALNYLNTDFSVLKSHFMGRIRTMREINELQRKPAKDLETKLHQKVRELEKEKKRLAQMLVSSQSDRKNWIVMMNDIDDQLNTLRGWDWHRELRNENTKESANQAAIASKQNLLATCESYERESVVRLSAMINERIRLLKEQESELAALRDRLSWFNVWPINLIIAMPNAE